MKNHLQITTLAAILLVTGIFIIISNTFAQTCNMPVPLTFGVPSGILNSCAPGVQNNYNESHACANRFMNGHEYVFTYTTGVPPLGAPNCISIDVDLLNSAFSTIGRGVFVFNGCPNNPGTNCIAQGVTTSAISNPSVSIDNLQLDPSTTYYIIVSSEGFGTNCFQFNFNITIGSGACTPKGIGADCSNPNIITSLPFNSTSLTTCNAYNDYNHANFIGPAANLNGEDYIFQYRPVNNECISIALNNTFNSTGLFVFNGCPTDNAKYLIASASGTNPNINYVALGGGKTYYIIVSTDPTFTPCTPFGISIGRTACCGTGSTCYDPEFISSLPFTQTGKTTCTSCNDYKTWMSSCNRTNQSLNGNDYVYSYTPSNNECIIIDISNTLSSNSSITIFDGCPDETSSNCISQSPITRDPTLSVFLAAGMQYYILISDINCTSFNININTQPLGAPGETCVNPYTINSLPFSQTGMTTGCFGNYYDPNPVCGWSGSQNGEDFIFEYTPSANESINVRLLNTKTSAGLYVFNGCPDAPGSSCIASGYNTSTGSLALCNVMLASGLTYYIIVDVAMAFTPFDIFIEYPNAPGVNCANPYIIDSIPFSQSNMTTKCYGNNYNINNYNLNNCSRLAPASAYTGEDFIFEYNSPGEELLYITLLNTTTFVSLFVIDGCPNDSSSNCIASVSNNRAPGLCVALTDSGTYYIIVDAPLSTNNTNFDITIELLDPIGSNCSNPYPIPSLPFNRTGMSTKCLTNNYNLTNDCGGGVAMGGEDIVFEYNSQGGEAINIKYTGNPRPSNPSRIFVYDRCPDDPARQCLGGTIWPSSSGLCNIELLDSGNYYILIDTHVGTGYIENFDITIEQGNQGKNCDNPYPVSIPFSQTGFSTRCFGNDYNNNHACNSISMNGDDFVFELEITTDECIQITAGNFSVSGGLFLLDGCPDDTATNCISQAICSTNGCDSVSLFASLSPGIYYIVVSARNMNAIQNFDFAINRYRSFPTINSAGPFCTSEGVIFLSAVPAGGTWSGPGIMDANTGAFAPVISGLGSHSISYSISSGCAGIYIAQIEVLNCCNLDFEMADFSGGWSAFSGICCPVAANDPGIINGRHSIMPRGGFDPQTGGSLPLVSNEGDFFSARLGNSGTGAEAERLTYRFIVNPDNAFFGFQYAVVIEDGGHVSDAQARFEVSMTDQAGNDIDCGTVDFIAIAASLSGFMPSTSNPTVQYKPWSTAVIDLTAYIGQIVTVDFRSGDCSEGGHYGYGYIDGLCEPVNIYGNEFCPGEDTVVLSALPGFMTYEWNTFPPQFTQSITIVDPQDGDTYSVTLTPTPGVGCPVTLSTTLKSLNILVDAGANDTVCSGNDYTLAGAISGDAHYIKWQTTGSGSFDNDSLLTATYTPSAADIASGSATLILTGYDSLNTCSNADTMVLTILTYFSVSLISLENVSCNGENDGSAIIEATAGGVSPYSYSWSPAVSINDTAGNLSAGDYTCIVSDMSGCSHSETITITQPDAITATTTYTDAACGTNTGSATVNPTGGTPIATGASYAYLWSPAAGNQQTATAINLAPGIYTCTVSDAKGCLETFEVAVNDSEGPVISLESQLDVTCNGGGDGAATLSVSGGTAPYVYTWSPPVGNNNTALNLSAGDYTIMVSDINNCSNTFNLSITEPDPFVITTSGDTAICKDKEIILSAAASGGTAPYSFTWDPGAVNNASVTVAPEQTSIYTVEATDANGCEAEPVPVTVTVHPLPAVSFTADPERGCTPVCVTFNNTGSNTNTISWNFGDGQSGTDTEINHCYVEAGNYNIILSLTDSNGCSNTLAAPGLVQVHPNPVAAFTMTPPSTAPVNSPVLFHDKSTGADHWQWNFGDIMKTFSSLQNPIFAYPEIGSYIVLLTATNNQGCVDTISQTIHIEPEFTLYIPNAFSPDNDGINDFFGPKGAQFEDFEMEIFNRWGERIYYTTEIDKPWDGGYKNGTAKQDVYIYKMGVKDFKEQVHYFVGEITLIK